MANGIDEADCIPKHSCDADFGWCLLNQDSVHYFIICLLVFTWKCYIWERNLGGKQGVIHIICSLWQMNIAFSTTQHAASFLWKKDICTVEFLDKKPTRSLRSFIIIVTYIYASVPSINNVFYSFGRRGMAQTETETKPGKSSLSCSLMWRFMTICPLPKLKKSYKIVSIPVQN